MNLSAILYLVALVLFLLAVFGVTLGSVPLLALALAFVAGGLLVGSLGVDRRVG